MNYPMPEKLHPNRLLPASSSGNTFSSFFPYLFNWIYKKREKPDWKTEIKYPLSSRTLWEKHQDSRQIIGVRFGTQTEYCMIDIDRRSPNHPANSIANFDRVIQACYSIGLQEHILIRSSGSEGLHLYFPLEYQVNSFNLACGLKYALESHRLEIANGILEIFPNTKSFDSEYNAHRLPLQDASYILRRDLYPISNSIEQFCSKWIDSAECQDLELLIEQCAIARSLYKPKYSKSGKLNDWQAELDSILSQGWTGPGQTNDLLHKITQYGRVFEGITDLSQLIEWATNKALHLIGFDKFCNHKHNLLKRVTDWARWVFDRNFPITDKKAGENMRYKSKVLKNLEYREKIRVAAIEIMNDDAVNHTIRSIVGELAKRCKTSLKRLYENAELWHPERIETVTVAQPSLEPEKSPAAQYSKPIETQSQSAVTDFPYEVLEDASNDQESINFAAPPFEASIAIAKILQATKIKLLEDQIKIRRSGRLDLAVYREIECLNQELAILKSEY